MSRFLAQSQFPTHIASSMRSAIAISEQARGRSSPNPPVGAVILDPDRNLVGCGSTEAPGHRHAEIVALDEAGERAQGGTLFVTLEPCNHYGRTEPCTNAIIGAGIKTVYCAVLDPNPVASGGVTRLRQAGVQVETGVLAAEARSGPLRAWLYRQRTGLPWITLKFASTLDGRIAAQDGSSQWITGINARRAVHEERSRIDALVVGSGTVRRDNPSLTARYPSGELMEHQPLRVVVGYSKIPSSSVLTDDDSELISWSQLFTHDPLEVVRVLAENETCLEAQVEGGPTLAGAFLDADAVNAVTAYIAPALLGSGLSAINSESSTSISDIKRFSLVDVSEISGDLRVRLVRIDKNAVDDST